MCRDINDILVILKYGIDEMFGDFEDSNTETALSRLVDNTKANELHGVIWLNVKQFFSRSLSYY